MSKFHREKAFKISLQARGVFFNDCLFESNSSSGIVRHSTASQRDL
ncbi:hypothetical protein [Mesorhizobium sp. M8A.F.Ca.ET.142.01.1.1]|nr:hypothetical protein [Mesorhizobium sp. M8A.F.Ca.ET.142.01.1.1]